MHNLQSAAAIAAARGLTLRSLLPPRSQFNPAYARSLSEAGFTSCRSNAAGWLCRGTARDRYGMQSLTMSDAADKILALHAQRAV